MKKIILILIAIAAIASGCDKYEQTIKKIYGDYTLKTYTVNGVDSLSLFNNYLGLAFHFYYQEENSHNIMTIDGPTTNGTNSFLIYTWGLINNYKGIRIYTATGISKGTGPFTQKITPEWKILSLTNGLKLITTYNEKVYLIELD